MVKSEPTRRKLPFPFGNDGKYRGSMVSITSDIDGCDRTRFLKNHYLINQQIKLDVSDSVFVFSSFSILDFLKTILRKRKYIKAISIESDKGFFFNQFSRGYIDSIHSLEELHKYRFFHRLRLKLLMRELKIRGVKINTWMDHSATPYNFGLTTYSNYNCSIGETHKFGDLKASKFYHTDLTVNSGRNIDLKFAWHNISPFENDDINFDYSFHNKFINNGDSKYVTEDILIPNQSRDGSKYHQFLRFYRTDSNQTADRIVFEQPYLSNICNQINEKTLDEIARLGYFSSIGTHLGYPKETSQRDLDAAIKSLELLRNYQDRKLILVTRTSRLLKYALLDKYIDWTYKLDNQFTIIYINQINDTHAGAFFPDIVDLRGLTFYVENPIKTKLYLNSNCGFKLLDRKEIVCNKSDGYSPSISIKWFDDYAPDFMLVDSFVDSEDNMLDCNSDVISSDIYSI